MKKKIYIDFDGVINNYSGWEDAELFDPKEGVKEFLEDLYKVYEVWIFTTRDRETIWKWLIRYHLDSYITEVTSIKGPAFAYIDDRAIRFDGDYNKLLDEIKDFKPYWKEEIGSE